jgi:predicted AAA+ superfamily ATPase
MNELLANAILKQKAEIRPISAAAFVHRELSQKVADGLSMDAIKVIIGPRRAGKSSLALQVLRDRNFAYLNLEDEDLSFEFSAEDALACFDRVYPGYEYILFDEIQSLPRWEKLINRLQRLGKNVIVTGSNSKLLSSELASSLTGRYIEFQLLPFSYAECLSATKESRGSDSFLKYLSMGGFPSVVTNRMPALDFLVTLWDAIVLKDLVQRYKIRRVSELKSLLYVALSSMSSRATARSLSRAVNEQLSHSTVSKFLKWAEGAYLCCALQTYSFKARERVNSDKKLYLFDNGFYSSHKVSATSDYGRLLENYVFIQLCRSGLVPNLSFFSLQTKEGYEVDFFVPEQKRESCLIQVAYSVDADKTKSREIRALVKAAREFGVDNLYLITCDQTEQRVEVDGYRIDVVPAWSERVAVVLNGEKV